ncbi:PIN domain-containing protein [Cupriavidus agavae]|uniref:Putative nucleic-acid-binding protein n=1 Tax=Cupriavidus agavae TaxID=1001822 RepID=A0A4Q7RS26_9BURK|nr:type II toxin-antitoxin system VapC family toxin [Cupriavidus agavae]RZT36495.1 putative nucleic-acid-binding protein [Cupriavidus agavae]
MIGLDSNIVLRFLARDDPRQTVRATAIMKSLSTSLRGFIPVAVLLEVVWTMRRQYGSDRASIARIVDYLIGCEELVVESSDVVKSALYLYRQKRGDFPDCLIMRACEAAGCSQTLTFDRRAAEGNGMRLVS